MAYEQFNGDFDFGFFSPTNISDVQVFRASNNGQGMQKWIKPRGVTMCYMFALGSGGGGGAGFSGVSGSARGGGGGGGGSCFTTLLKSALILPDILSVQVGTGGKGGASSGSAGGIGQLSYISLGSGVTTLTTIPNLVLTSCNSTTGGGGAGSAAGAGSIGLNASAITLAALGHSGALSIFNPSNGGESATAGGVQTGAVGVSISNHFQFEVQCGGGTGGGGVNVSNTGFAGGSISNIAVFESGDIILSPAASFAPGGTAGSSTILGGDGTAGFFSSKPFVSFGGTGGGSADGQSGGRGGRGAFGSGGGGGGAGTTGGSGGDGGDGLVVIISW